MIVDLDALALDARPVEDDYVRPRDRRPKNPRRPSGAAQPTAAAPDAADGPASPEPPPLETARADETPPA